MIERLCVVGAGTMGHGIAYAGLLAGCETRLYDPSADALERGRASIEQVLQQAVSIGKLPSDAGPAALARLSLHSSLDEAAAGAEFVIEAAPEQLALKLDVLSRLNTAAPATAILATNTSALSITELATALRDARRLGGMHFFNPVHKMKLVEIVRGLETSDETIAGIGALAHAMGKETVIVRESPGFVTSRVNAMIGNEAFYMLQEGVASARDIDKALRLGLNHPMGPFELVDLVGLDTRLGVLEFLHKSLGEKYRPSPLLVQYVRAGRLGKKVGRGVYEYP
jgi:3-hydroxybutyryl-CoA dehydrogenase